MPWVLHGRLDLRDVEGEKEESSHWLRPGRVYRFGRSKHTKFAQQKGNGPPLRAGERMIDFPVASSAMPAEGADLVVGPWSVDDADGRTTKTMQQLRLSCNKSFKLDRDGQDIPLPPTAHDQPGHLLHSGDALRLGSSLAFRVEWVPFCVCLETDDAGDHTQIAELGGSVRTGKQYLPEVTHYVSSNARINLRKCLYAANDKPVVGRAEFLQNIIRRIRAPAFPGEFDASWKRQPGESFDAWDKRIYALPDPPQQIDGQSEDDHVKALQAWAKQCHKARLKKDAATFTKLNDGEATPGVDFGLYWKHCELEDDWQSFWPNAWSAECAAPSSVDASGQERTGTAWLEVTRRGRRNHVFSSVLLVQLNGTDDTERDYGMLVTAGRGLYLRVEITATTDVDDVKAQIDDFKRRNAQNGFTRVALFDGTGTNGDFADHRGEQTEKGNIAALVQKCRVSKLVTKADLMLAVYEASNRDVATPLVPEESSQAGTMPMPLPTHPEAEGSLIPGSSLNTGSTSAMTAPPVPAAPAAARRPAPPTVQPLTVIRSSRRGRVASDSSDDDEPPSRQARSHLVAGGSRSDASSSQVYHSGRSAPSGADGGAPGGSTTQPAQQKQVITSIRRRQDDSSSDDDYGYSGRSRTRTTTADKEKDTRSSKRRRVGSDKSGEDEMQVDEDDGTSRAPKTVEERKKQAQERVRGVEEHQRREAEERKKEQERATAAAAATKKRGRRNAGEAAQAAAEAVAGGVSPDEDGIAKKKGGKAGAAAAATKKGTRKEVAQWEQKANQEFHDLYTIKKKPAHVEKTVKPKFDAGPDLGELYWQKVIEDAENDDPDKWMPKAEGQFVVKHFKISGVKKTVSPYPSRDNGQGEQRMDGKKNFKVFKNVNIHPRLALQAPPSADFGLAPEEGNKGKGPDVEAEEDETDPAFRPKKGKVRGAQLKLTQMSRAKASAAAAKRATRGAGAASTSKRNVVRDSEDEEDELASDPGQHSSNTLTGDVMSEDDDEDDDDDAASTRSSRSRSKGKGKGKASATSKTQTKSSKATSGSGTKSRAPSAPKRQPAKKAQQTTLVLPEPEESDSDEASDAASAGGVKFKGLKKSTQMAGRGIKRSRV